jgi:hypothetical protein
VAGGAPQKEALQGENPRETTLQLRQKTTSKQGPSKESRQHDKKKQSPNAQKIAQTKTAPHG